MRPLFSGPLFCRSKMGVFYGSLMKIPVEPAEHIIGFFQGKVEHACSDVPVSLFGPESLYSNKILSVQVLRITENTLVTTRKTARGFSEGLALFFVWIFYSRC